jgi:hypothetical protein
MIIAFYPGAGGNRCQRMMQNLEWQQSNIAYDAVNLGQNYKNRYLLGDAVNTDQDFILTHCLNKTHLQNKIPGHDIVFIVGDIKACLQREWRLAGETRGRDRWRPLGLLAVRLLYYRVSLYI